jgi:hypothetical protein
MGDDFSVRRELDEMKSPAKWTSAKNLTVAVARESGTELLRAFTMRFVFQRTLI